MRIEAKVDLADFTLFKGLVATLMFVMGLVRAQRTTLARLRRFFGFSSSEKTAEVLAEDDKSTPVPPPRAGSEPAGATGSAGATEPAGATGSAGATEPAEATEPAGATEPAAAAAAAAVPPKKRKGHGRVAATEYEVATHFPVPHQTLTPGAPCPGCACGKLYELAEPAKFLRIVGQPLLSALCWDCQRLRCTACGDVYTACAPKEAQGPKFDESAVSILALCRYGLGLLLTGVGKRGIPVKNARADRAT